MQAARPGAPGCPAPDVHDAAAPHRSGHALDGRAHPAEPVEPTTAGAAPAQPQTGVSLYKQAGRVHSSLRQACRCTCRQGVRIAASDRCVPVHAGRACA